MKWYLKGYQTFDKNRIQKPTTLRSRKSNKKTGLFYIFKEMDKKRKHSRKENIQDTLKLMIYEGLLQKELNLNI